MNKLSKLLPAIFLSAILPANVFAATTVVVTPANQQGFVGPDTTAGGEVRFVTDTSAPLGRGALQLTTTALTASKAQYGHAASTALSAVTDLSYYTKQIAPAGAVADASYQLPVYLKGTSGFSTLVFEPYQNPSQGAIVSGVWQKWDVDAGLFWSTQTAVCSGGTINGTPGGPANYTLSQIKAICPSAAVLGFGVNIGSNNPSYQVRVDGLTFNDTTYDFETAVVAPPTTFSQCLSNGYLTFNSPRFNTQNQCLVYVFAHNGFGSTAIITNNNTTTRVNTNSITVVNSSTQTSTTGSASSSFNTNGGSATSGPAGNTSSTSTSVSVSN